MMRTIVAVSVALLVALSSVALAGYDARKGEALADLDKSQATAEEKVTIKATLEKYFSARADCLEAILAIVKNDESKDQAAIFAARANICASTGSQVLGDGLDDLGDPSVGALGFLNVLASDEAAFYQALVALQVADSRDRIIVIGDRLAEMANILEEKWDALSDEDESLDQRAKRVNDEIRKDFDDAIKRAADANPDIAEKILEGVRQWSASATSPDVNTGIKTLDLMLAVVKQLGDVAIGMWQATNTRSESRAGAYGALFSSERRVLVMFLEVRDDVREFMEKNDFPVAETAYSAGKSSADGFASGMRTSGQKNDATALRNDLLRELAEHLADTARVYGDFVNDHREKFFGAIGPDIEKELLELNAWREWASYFQGYGLDAKIRAWQSNATNYFGVDLSPLSSAARDHVKNGLRAIIDELVRELDVANKNYRDIKGVLGDGRDNLEDELD